MTDAADNIGTTAVRAGFAFDEAALEQWMRANVPGYAGPLRVTQFRGGQSNPTYRLDTPTRAYVLRRKPPGVLLKGAHAIEREARVLSALGSIGYPVAHVHALCTEAEVIGTPFYVMDLVEGRVFWDASFSDVPRGERAGYFEAMNAAIADLHAIDPAAVGLADYGRPGDYFARQIARWSGQYHADTEAGRDANMDRLIDWLHANVPAGDDDTGIIHGDFRCDNMIFESAGPRILAVLDWELSTLGHRGADFAYHTMMYRMPPYIVAGLGGADVGALGLPSEGEYVAAYCAHRGLSDLPNYDFYVAFNFFRLAAIFHGIKGRVLRGSAASAQARQRVEVLPELMRLAWAQAERAGTR
ncbi:Predicted kinase, aminoglycoside phosphotransferase (APT) family [Sphingomonas palmae]|uniref:Predicted kinase, aminoglycoside phosphotransferase (APT) family n=1 Tax=Sphingomonas palmae TaxID=1855283 RepID=A0A1H7TRL1_9SPHN|nr:phosphotransferase [Sphingomonas palmae]SEL87149.1 Predicted kinase, aminoglycoside phosphotransferase (APT) family [Sphingomonas palmae]